MNWFKGNLCTTGFLPILIGLVAVSCSDNSESTLNAEDADIDVSVEADIANGEYVVGFAHCSGCHSPDNNKHPGSPQYLAGNKFSTPNGVTDIPNITPDAVSGIGSWSDAEIEAAIREGKRPDGTMLHPLMPYRWLKVTTFKDMRDMIAFLRSVPAVQNTAPSGREVAFDAKAFGYPPSPPSGDGVDAEVARGAYVVWLAHCMSCHTPATEGVSDYENKLGVGGDLFEGPIPAIAANLTPHEEDGISHYSVQDIAMILKTGKRPDGSDVAPIMGPRLETASQKDLEAVAVYLKSLPPQPTPQPE